MSETEATPTVTTLAGKVDAETAAAEFDRFAEIWDIDADEEGLDEEDLKSLRALKRKLVRAIVSGRLRLDDDGTLTVKLSYSDKVNQTELQLRVPQGNAIVGWDKHKESQGVHRLNTFLGAMSGEPPKLFALIDHRDLKVPQAVAQLFLGS